MLVWKISPSRRCFLTQHSSRVRHRADFGPVSDAYQLLSKHGVESSLLVGLHARHTILFSNPRSLLGVYILGRWHRSSVAFFCSFSYSLALGVDNRFPWSDRRSFFVCFCCRVRRTRRFLDCRPLASHARPGSIFKSSVLGINDGGSIARDPDIYIRFAVRDMSR